MALIGCCQRIGKLAVAAVITMKDCLPQTPVPAFHQRSIGAVGHRDLLSVSPTDCLEADIRIIEHGKDRRRSRRRLAKARQEPFLPFAQHMLLPGQDPLQIQPVPGKRSVFQEALHDRFRYPKELRLCKGGCLHGPG